MGSSLVPPKELTLRGNSSFHDLFTTRYTPGWGEYSIHKWIEYDHPKGEYGVEFDKILRDSKNCCEALKEIRKLIYDYHRLGEYGPSFVGPIKVPLHRYRNANHSTGDLLDKFIDIACNQPPNLPPLTRRVPEPVLIPRRVPPLRYLEWFHLHSALYLRDPFILLVYLQGPFTPLVL